MHSRLEGLRVYLSGPCEYAADFGSNWRKAVTPELEELGLTVFDPTNCKVNLSFCNSKQDEFKLTQKLKTEGKFEELAKCMREIIHLDLRLVDSADLLIVKLDKNSFTCGTIDEMIMALNQKKPVYLCCEQGKREIPLWLWGRMPTRYIFENLQEIMAELTEIAYCEDDELSRPLDTRRWLFLNQIKKD